jgi:alpha-tubulin suppressor-like RCC1 family protein
MGNGTVVCWGDATMIGRPFLPECGDGVPSTYDLSRGTHAPIEGLDNVVALSASHSHTCALQGSGDVRCWGEGYYDQILGTAPPPCASESCALPYDECGRPATTCTVCRREPLLAPFPGNAVSIAAGGTEDCAALEDGTVWCHGRTGVRRIDGITQAVEVAAGADFFCARESWGGVLCWGNDAYGQLGDGIAGGSRDMARGVEYIVEGSGGAASVVAHHLHACAIGFTGELWCWGDSTRGQTLDGTASPTPSMGCSAARAQPLPLRPPPAVLGSELTAVMVAVGGVGVPGSCAEGHTCWLASDGRVRCAGANLYGQCGVGGTPRPRNVVPGGAVVPLPEAARLVAAGGVASCAVTGAAWDQVWCWGRYTPASPSASSEVPRLERLPGTRL